MNPEVTPEILLDQLHEQVKRESNAYIMGKIAAKLTVEKEDE